MKLRGKIDGLQSLLLLTAAMARQPFPRPRGVEERLRQIPLTGAPLKQPVTIHWDQHHIPFIEAATDRDCAVALGVVHAHLRLGQIEMVRRIAYGRTAEMVGPAGIELDHALRAFDFPRAVPGIVASMSDATRQWLASFADGINHVLMNAPELPPEFAWLGLRREPWRVEDIVAIGRLSGADIHWMIWLKLLRLRGETEWNSLWDTLLDQGGISNAPAAGTGTEAALGTILAGAHTGSNSFAVRGASGGGAWIASDPHLPVTVPNIWLLAGYRCPSYHAVGFMLPALPFIGLGRNINIGWGGTNLHAASSDFVDASALEVTHTRRETISVRGGEAVERTVGETALGPIVSDAPLLATGSRFVLRWTGHGASDEFGAMLGMNRATNWKDFAAAADGFGLPGQNFIYADGQGHVGKLIGAILPRRPGLPAAKLLATPNGETGWDRLANSHDMPRTYDRGIRWVASANDEPPPTPFPLGYFYSTPDRVQRIGQVLESMDDPSERALTALQQDIHLAPALPLRDLILGRLALAASTGWEQRLYGPMLRSLRKWDGSYGPASTGALAFEAVFARLLAVVLSPGERQAYGTVWHTRSLLQRRLAALPPNQAAAAVAKAVGYAWPVFRRYRDWGSVHRLRLRHPLGVVPGLGKRFHFEEWGTGGNEETVMKTAGPDVSGVHGVSYGSIARHVSKLDDPDENHFTLLGGQDGWFGSDTMFDQVKLWRAGRTIRVPLTLEAVRSRFAHKVVLTPENA